MPWRVGFPLLSANPPPHSLPISYYKMKYINITVNFDRRVSILLYYQERGCEFWEGRCAAGLIVVSAQERYFFSTGEWGFFAHF
jgi:hypothetical protein